MGACKIALDLSHSLVTRHAWSLPNKQPRKLCKGMRQAGWPVTKRQEWGEGSKGSSGGLQAGGLGYMMRLPYSHQGHPGWAMSSHGRPIRLGTKHQWMRADPWGPVGCCPSHSVRGIGAWRLCLGAWEKSGFTEILTDSPSCGRGCSRHSWSLHTEIRSPPPV